MSICMLCAQAFFKPRRINSRIHYFFTVVTYQRIRYCKLFKIKSYCTFLNTKTISFSSDSTSPFNLISALLYIFIYFFIIYFQLGFRKAQVINSWLVSYARANSWKFTIPYFPLFLILNHAQYMSIWMIT